MYIVYITEKDARYCINYVHYPKNYNEFIFFNSIRRKKMNIAIYLTIFIVAISLLIKVEEKFQRKEISVEENFQEEGI